MALILILQVDLNKMNDFTIILNLVLINLTILTFQNNSCAY